MYVAWRRRVVAERYTVVAPPHAQRVLLAAAAGAPHRYACHEGGCELPNLEASHMNVVESVL